MRKLLLRQASSAVEVAALKGGDRILLCQTGLHRSALGGGYLVRRHGLGDQLGLAGLAATRRVLRRVDALELQLLHELRVVLHESRQLLDVFPPSG